MKSLKEKIEVMQAFESGEKIESRVKGCTLWEYVAIPLWNFDRQVYRIKQKPMEIFVFVADSGIKMIVDNGNIATDDGVIYKFKQVMK